MVSFPSINFWRGGAEPYRFVVWKRVELCAHSASGDDDASLAVTRREDAKAACLKMELGCVPSSGQRVPRDDDFELATLQSVGCVDGDRPGSNAEGGAHSVDGSANQRTLVSVSDANSDVLRREGVLLLAIIESSSADKQVTDDLSDGLNTFGVSPRKVGWRKLDQTPSVLPGGLDDSL